MDTGSASVQMALYDDNSSSPGSLVAWTDGTSLSPGFNEIDVVEPVALSAGTYWLMAAYDAALYAYPRYDSAGAERIYYASHTYGTALPSTFSGLNYCCQSFNYYILVE